MKRNKNLKEKSFWAEIFFIVFLSECEWNKYIVYIIFINSDSSFVCIESIRLPQCYICLLFESGLVWCRSQNTLKTQNQCCRGMWNVRHPFEYHFKKMNVRNIWVHLESQFIWLNFLEVNITLKYQFRCKVHIAGS